MTHPFRRWATRSVAPLTLTLTVGLVGPGYVAGRASAAGDVWLTLAGLSGMIGTAAAAWTADRWLAAQATIEDLQAHCATLDDINRRARPGPAFGYELDADDAWPLDGHHGLGWRVAYATLVGIPVGHRLPVAWADMPGTATLTVVDHDPQGYPIVAGVAGCPA